MITSAVVENLPEMDICLDPDHLYFVLHLVDILPVVPSMYPSSHLKVFPASSTIN